MVAAAYLIAGACLLILFAALRLPSPDASFETAGDKVAVSADGLRLAVLDPAAPVTLRGRAGRVTAPAAELVPDYVPPGPPERVRAWYADRDRLATLAAEPEVTLILPGASRVLRPHARRLADVSADVWLLLGQGAAIGLLGAGLLASQGARSGVREFALSCLAVLVAALSGALFDARELTADARWLRGAEALNELGSLVCGAALAAVFLRAPRRLPPGWGGAAMVGAAVLLAGARAVDALPLSAFYLGLLAFNACGLAALVAQWVAARRDAAARAVLRWVGATTLLGGAALGAAMATPALLGTPAWGGDGMSIVPLFVVYGGIAFGIGGRRLFELDRWTYRLMLGAVGALALLALDAALVAGLGVAPPAALAVSLLAIGYGYFPVRAALWRRLWGTRALAPAELIRAATEVALTPQLGDRRLRWRELLRRLYDPLDLDAAAPAPAAPELAGADLLIPPAAGEGALRLRHRSRGRSLFSADDLRLARELLRLLEWAEGARESYSRGMAEERQRIARDLHDDVSATLLTSLHRTQLAQAKGDVRKAMAEIRAAVSSLGGEAVPVGRVLADLRFETAERLASAGVELDWPIAACALDATPMTYGPLRALTASHREIVSNLLRHSGARRARVRVELSPAELTVEVQDDGCGLPVDVDARQGGGLRNVAHRLARAGGEATLSDAAPGLRIITRLPLATAEAPAA